jgi:TolB-like protein/Tfp pilus assembly protein PilF
LPDKPSIAVLPFTNMSGDRDQEYFSDGITDDLTTALSRLPDLFVIARTSAFTYKGKAAKVQDIGRELGVAYVLEGSVRKADNQVRITAQLVDAATGDHLWAEHYDRPLKDIFSLQDELVRRIVTTLKLQLPLDTQWRGYFFAQHTDNPEAYDDYLRGDEYVVATFSAAGISKAKEMFEKAIELDPAYSDAYAMLGYTYFWSWYSQYSGDDPEVLDRAIGLEQKAIALNDAHANAHANLCRFYPFKRQYDQAVTECQRAIKLAPSYPYSDFSFAEALNRSGKPREAIGFVESAERIDPRNRGLYELDRGVAYILMGRYAEAIPIFKTYFVSYPHVMWAHVWQAIAYSELGREQEARAEAVEIMRISPGFSLKAEKERMSLQDQPLEERYLADLRKAGLK